MMLQMHLDITFNIIIMEDLLVHHPLVDLNIQNQRLKRRRPRNQKLLLPIQKVPRRPTADAVAADVLNHDHGYSRRPVLPG